MLCFRPQVLTAVLKENQASSSYEFGRDIIPMMMEQGMKVFGYKFNGYWGYSRTVDEYWRTSMDLLGDKPLIDMEQWGIRTNLEHRGIRDCQPLQVGKDGLMDNSMAYNGCIVEGKVRNSILFPGVRVAKGAEVSNSILFFNNVVKEDSKLERVISDVNTTFGSQVRIGTAQGRVTVIGWNNQVPDGMVIGGGCTVAPEIPDNGWPQALADLEELR